MRKINKNSEFAIIFRFCSYAGIYAQKLKIPKNSHARSKVSRFPKKSNFVVWKRWTVCVCEGVSEMLNFFLCYEDKYTLLHMLKVCYTISETKFFFTIIYVAEENSISIT